MLTYEKLDTNLVSVNQLSFVNDDAVNYEIEYSKDYDDAYPLYLVFNDVDVYFSCVDGKKILSFCSNRQEQQSARELQKLWNEFKEEIRTIKAGIEPFEYEKDVMRIKFESDNGLPLGKILNIPACVIVVRSVFEESGKLYPQVYLGHCCLEYDNMF